MNNLEIKVLVKGWLNELGGPNRNADGVYQSLKDAGIKGRPLRSADCPVARYLNGYLEAMGTPYRVLVGNHFVTIKSAHNTYVADVVIPQYVMDFIVKFDYTPDYAPELRAERN